MGKRIPKENVSFGGGLGAAPPRYMVFLFLFFGNLNKYIHLFFLPKNQSKIFLK